MYDDGEMKVVFRSSKYSRYDSEVDCSSVLKYARPLLLTDNERDVRPGQVVRKRKDGEKIAEKLINLAKNFSENFDFATVIYRRPFVIEINIEMEYKAFGPHFINALMQLMNLSDYMEFVCAGTDYFDIRLAYVIDYITDENDDEYPDEYIYLLY